MHDRWEVEVFRAGDYGAKGRWDEAALERLAADYDPRLHEAPVTLDHAQRGPALGWVESLRRVGDRLVARLRGLNRRLLELIRAGAFKKRSIELYPRLAATGRPYLRAVSFLGAAVPEVKGLADPLLPEPAGTPLFADGDDAPEPIPIDWGDADAAPGAPAAVAEPPTAFAELVERLRAAGRWQPAWAERGIEAFYRALASIDTVTIDAPHAVPPAQWFAEFLMALPPAVAMGEAAAPDAPADPWMEPSGAPIAAESLALHRQALAWQAAHPGVEYAEALRRCASRR